MNVERRNRLALVLLVIVLSFALYRVWTATSAGPAPASNAREATPAARRGTTPEEETPDVHLRALNSEHPKPGTTQRNLFRFKPKAPPPPPTPPRPVTPAGSGSFVSGPLPPPPINLKFIGIIEQSGGKPKIAVLTDGIGPPLYGEEGKEVAGRYKILRIGAESIEMSYLDGRGRQTIRLTGGS